MAGRGGGQRVCVCVCVCVVCARVRGVERLGFTGPPGPHPQAVCQLGCWERDEQWPRGCGTGLGPSQSASRPAPPTAFLDFFLVERAFLAFSITA